MTGTVDRHTGPVWIKWINDAFDALHPEAAGLTHDERIYAMNQHLPPPVRRLLAEALLASEEPDR